MYSRSVLSFCVALSSCRVGGCRVGPPPPDPNPDPEQNFDFHKNFAERHHIWWISLVYKE